MKKSNKVINGIAIGAVLAAGSIIYFSKRQTIPRGIEAVKNFDAEKYLGKWYEIARLDFRYEKNINNTTAHYSLNEDGSIKVVNRGFNYKKNEYEEAVGKAIFVDSPQEAKLKVSFFGPFYAGYNVIAIDKSYKYALVVGRSRDYLWLLSRRKSMPENIKEEYLQLARKLGYKTENLVWIEHNREE